MYSKLRFIAQSVLLFLLMMFFAFPVAQFSQIDAAACDPTYVSNVRITPSTFGSGTISEIQVVFDGRFLESSEEYAVMVFDNKLSAVPEEKSGFLTKSSEMAYKFTSTAAVTSDDISGDIDRHNIYLYTRSQSPIPTHSNSLCLLGTYDVEQGKISCSRLEIMQERNGQACYDQCIELGKDVVIKATGITRTFSNTSIPYSGIITLDVVRGLTDIVHESGELVPVPAGTLTYGIPGSDFKDAGELNLTMYGHFVGNNGAERITGCTSASIVAKQSCDNQCAASPTPLPNTGGGGGGGNPGPGAQPGAPDTFSFCSQINDANLRSECTACAEGDKGYAGVWTAIGCIKRDPEAIVRKFMIVGLSMGGGVALLTFLAAGFMLSTSQGNTQQTDQAKQMLTASITGLLFIIFSVTILEYIGYSILGIPGFGG